MNGVIGAFARHRIAPNLLLVIMIAGGLFVAGRIEKRFFPEFEIQTIVVRAPWSGASTEDVGDALLTPIENRLRHTDDLKKMYSFANDGGGVVYLEFPDTVDLDQAGDDVRRRLDLALPDLPDGAETPEISIIEERDGIMRLAVSGGDLQELRPLARRLEEEIIQLGIVYVEVRGLPKEEIEIRLSQRRLNEIGLTPREVGAQIRRQNVDVSAGNVSAGGGQLLRTLSKRENLSGIADLTVWDARGNPIRLGDIADIVRGADEDEETILFDGRPAVELYLQRRAEGDILQTARAIHRWLAEAQKKLPPGVQLQAHDERWLAVESRLQLLVKNGLQGLTLVLLLLFLFLNGGVAFWVAMGIPATFMVALAAMYLLGGSVNMLSMFALIMTTGIVVDDAIVAGENALHRLQQGRPPAAAAIDGVREMFPAVLASTFTTLASFLPLFIVGGVIGAILFDIPFVVLCVLTASLFECFLVLPGHLLSAFRKMEKAPKINPVRRRLETLFADFQEGTYRRWVGLAVRYRLVTVAAAFSLLMLAAALFAGGAVKYRFFPGGELRRINVQADFVVGTAKPRVAAFADYLRDTLQATVADFPREENLLSHSAVYFSSGGYQFGGGGRGKDGGAERMNMVVELSAPDERRVKLSEFVKEWRQKVELFPGMENLTMREERGGPPGEDLSIRLAGGDAETLKSAARRLQEVLMGMDGLSLARDDMPHGKRQIIFELTPLGRSLGLSADEVAAQLRDAFDGYFVQTFYDGVDEKDLRVVIGAGDSEDFSKFRVRLPNGDFAFLQDAVVLSSRRGFETIQRINTRPAVHVFAEVDFSVTDVRAVQNALLQEALPELSQRFGVSHSFEGLSADERETVTDMKTGLAVALVAIFLILAAVFASWTLPLVVILTSPLALIGAVLGHWLLGHEVSILSAFGVFTLNGIVVNDSIILVRDYLLRAGLAQNAGRAADEMIVDTACRRLRAMLVTSLTTICGLLPLMFESSLQAQFLIPMAISICFGLAFATLLVLFLAPAYLSYHESLCAFAARTGARWTRRDRV